MNIPVRTLAIIGMLGALTAVLGQTPLGMIPVPTPAGAATTLHIPTILAGILEGPVAGGFVGLIFGAVSFMLGASPAFKDPLIAFLPRILIGVLAAYSFAAVQDKKSRPIASALVGLLLGFLMFQVRPVVLEQLGEADPARLALFLQPAAEPVAAWVVISIIIGALAAFGLYRLMDSGDAPAAIGALVGTFINTAGVLTLMVLRGYLGAAPASVYAALSIGVLHGIPEILIAIILVTILHRAIKASRPGARSAGV